jgi:tRNA pseudouridine32 synthase/23S rRNA pseudouridine746 synthase/23S rRNA pseudouridine1911/1915/1917 synthase
MTSWIDFRERHRLFEDDAVLVVDKPAGIAVIGERHAADLVDLAREAGEDVMPAHRIDKVTSGAVVFAKTAEAHASLARQFNRRSIEKAYLAVVRGGDVPASGSIDLPLAVGRKNRVRVAAPRSSIDVDPATNAWSVMPSAVFADKRTYPARTDFGRAGAAGDLTLVVAQPLSGRRHQIRVHLAWIGFPILGDPLFAGAPALRTYLHAWQVAFDATWAGGERVVVEAPPAPDFWAPLGDETPDHWLAAVRLALGALGGDA